MDLLIRKTLIDNSESVQAKTQKNPSLSLNRQLELLSISKIAYYYTKKEPFSSEKDKILLDAIDKIYTEHPYYGARRMQKALESIGIKVGKRKLSRIYKLMGIRALYPPPKTTILNEENKKYPYLLNQTTATQKPNQIWSGDITYIKLEKGYAYIEGSIDWHSKKVLSWKLSNTMGSYLTTSILEEAIEKYGKPEIFNSDQGSQYTLKEHIEKLKKNGIKISMNAKGKSIDNIVIERFWRTLKYENLYLKAIAL
ncbi:Integrase catalytic region [Sulfurihydrogenibium sp. YO3AOP1]|uniref:IS3 family transposase n=1 Tax=Sulfurihydrogenibium sp. (strain YO3AOP1) TaxID=436114 RepID=UPI0001725E37|nr:IS3 family transposase [Sulfurihydrogenibium sp. YO3AOP1]ACD67014.1 Integrase catalytic region [Sulfurihydrogenibium sp. YO3AOP1]